MMTIRQGHLWVDLPMLSKLLSWSQGSKKPDEAGTGDASSPPDTTDTHPTHTSPFPTGADRPGGAGVAEGDGGAQPPANREQPHGDDDDDLPPPPSGGFVIRPPTRQQEGDGGDMPACPEDGFRCLSNAELHGVLGGQGLPGLDDDEDDDGTCQPHMCKATSSYATPYDDEKWDCKFTIDVECKPPPESPEGDPVIINEYHVQKHLGAGSFGSVKLVERRAGEPPYKEYAMKVLSKHRLRRFRQSIVSDETGRMIVKTGEDMVKSEIAVLRHLYHRNVVLLFEVLDDPVDDHIFLVMEYLEGGLSMVYDKDTRTFSSPLSKGVMPQDLACKLFFGLLSGLQYLHGRRICHRDIKPENLLVTQGSKLRITDFGSAHQFREGEDETLRDTAGTFSFLAPECCSGESFSAYPPDVWAAGVTLYCFIYGRLPFSHDAIESLFDMIQTQEPAYDEAENVTAPLLEVMRGCLAKKPEDRWALPRLRMHEWLEAPRREDEELDKEIAAEADGAKDEGEKSG